MKRTATWEGLRIARAAMAMAIAAAATASAQDFTVRMSSEDGTTTNYISRTATRYTDPGLKVDVIYRLADGKILSIDHQKKTYSELTFAEARQKNAQAAAAMSPQRREMMHRMGLDAAPEVTKLGPGETIAGYATERYASKTPMMETEMWAAPALLLPPAYYEVVTSGAGTATPFGGLAKFGEASKKINGMVLKQVTTTTMGGKRTITKVATSVDKSPIPPSAFEPPEGYKSAP